MPQDAGNLFIEKLLQEAGLTDLPTDYKEEYIAKLQEQLNRRVGLIILENLNDADADQFEEAINSSPAKSIEELQSFFSEKIPGLEDKIKEGLAEFASQFISSAKK